MLSNEEIDKNAWRLTCDVLSDNPTVLNNTALRLQ